MDVQDELRWVPLQPAQASSGAGTTLAEGDEDAGARSDKTDRESLEFSWEGVEGLAATHDLCATGPAFELALADVDPAMSGCVVCCFRQASLLVLTFSSSRGTSLFPWWGDVEERLSTSRVVVP